MSKTVAPTEIPEVLAFMEIDAEIQKMKKIYPGVFEELMELAERRNTLLEAADKAVREKNVSCGPFNQYQTATTYDAEKFYDAVGREDFLKLGGAIETVPQYSINKSMFDSLAAQGKITKDVVDAVKKLSPRYKKPEKMVIP